MQNQWPAMVAVVISSLSFVVSCVALWASRKTATSSVAFQLTQFGKDINEAFARSNVKSPYAVRLGIPDEYAAEFTTKAVLLLHQINQLRVVYDNQRLLGKHRVASWKNWAIAVLGPWIEQDDVLCRVCKFVLDSRESYDKGFHEWLRQVLPDKALSWPSEPLGRRRCEGKRGLN